MESWDDFKHRAEKEGRDHYESQLRKKTQTGSAADRAVALSAYLAYKDAEESGLLPYADDDGKRYSTAGQAYLASCYARQDIAAVFHMHAKTLHLLYRLHLLGWFAILLLIYIAFRVS